MKTLLLGIFASATAMYLGMVGSNTDRNLGFWNNFPLRRRFYRQPGYSLRDENGNGIDGKK